MSAISLLKGLSEEKVFSIDSKSKLPFPIKGITRLISRQGDTLGIVLDKATLDEIEEELESSHPAFLASLEESRKSGRVPGKDIRKKSGL